VRVGALVGPMFCRLALCIPGRDMARDTTRALRERKRFGAWLGMKRLRHGLHIRRPAAHPQPGGCFARGWPHASACVKSMSPAAHSGNERVALQCRVCDWKA
jgi:hypothetical protein